MELPAHDIPQLPRIQPEKRKDPKVRRQMSGPAIRTFFGIADVWKLSGEEQRALLGWPSESALYKYKAGQVATLSFDTLIRISLVLGIYKDLQILFPEQSLAHAWVRLPNSNQMFGGQAPLTYMTEGGIDALFHVRRLLDGRRGAWS